MEKALLFSIWLVAAIWVWNKALDLISASSSVENLVGIFILLLVIFISIKTRCLTKIMKLWEKE